MDRPDLLINEILTEDRNLLLFLEKCPRELRDIRTAGGTMSPKETLGHLAFWDSFAVHHFSRKLTESTSTLPVRVDFEKQSRAEVERIRDLPFSEVQALYERATENLVLFLRTRWHNLNIKERQDFHIPLKHRRHHRFLLQKSTGIGPIGKDLRKQEGQA